MTKNLICAFEFKSGSKPLPLDAENIFSTQAKNTWRWLHFERTGPEVHDWLVKEIGLSESIAHSLLAEETRPRVQAVKGGHVLNLRGVNLNPDASPEDMVAVRIWVDKQRVISLRKPKIAALQAIREDCINGKGPASIGDFLTQLVVGLIQRKAPVIADLDDTLDALEELQIEVPSIEHRNQLGALRRRAITLKRFLAPQREALMNFSLMEADWLGSNHAQLIREAHDQTARMVEALDAIRERAGLLHEEFSSQMAERNNRNSYVLTVIAAIFLPLGFLTGLLGVNVGGMPGVDNPWAFLWVTFLIIVLGILEFVILKWMRWI